MIVEAIIAFLLVVAGIFGLVGSYGLVKLPDEMTRLHAPTKAATLGVGGALIASVLYFTFVLGHPSLHEFLISLFLFITAPIAAFMIAKVQLHLTWREQDLPPTGSDAPWATFAPGENQDLVDQERDFEAALDSKSLRGE